MNKIIDICFDLYDAYKWKFYKHKVIISLIKIENIDDHFNWLYENFKYSGYTFKLENIGEEYERFCFDHNRNIIKEKRKSFCLSIKFKNEKDAMLFKLICG